MSERNLDIPRRLIDAYNRGDIPSFLDCLDPEVEWIPIMAALEDEEYHDLGDRVLILGRWRARGRSSGVELTNQPATWLYEIKDGRAVWMRTFTDRAEALESAGVSAQDISQTHDAAGN